MNNVVTDEALTTETRTHVPWLTVCDIEQIGSMDNLNHFLINFG